MTDNETGLDEATRQEATRQEATRQEATSQEATSQEATSPGPIIERLYRQLERNGQERVALLQAISQTARTVAERPGATLPPGVAHTMEHPETVLDANCRCQCDQCPNCMNMWWAPHPDLQGGYIPLASMEEVAEWISLILETACSCSMKTIPGQDIRCLCPRKIQEERLQEKRLQEEEHQPAESAQEPETETSRGGRGPKRPRDQQLPRNIQELLAQHGPLHDGQIMQMLDYQGLRVSLLTALRRHPGTVRIPDGRWALRATETKATETKATETAPTNGDPEPPEEMIPEPPEEMIPEPSVEARQQEARQQETRQQEARQQETRQQEARQQETRQQEARQQETRQTEQPEPTAAETETLIKAARQILATSNEDIGTSNTPHGIHSSTLYLRLLQTGLERDHPAMRNWRQIMLHSPDIRCEGDWWIIQTDDDGNGN